MADKLTFFVNGQKNVLDTPNPEMTLLQYLRRTLYLTGAKEACGQGACGACTVMMSYYNIHLNKVINFSTNACMIPLCYLHGMAVTTVEGIGSTKNGLHYIQQSFVNSHGLQCGFCTPGMVMTMYCLLKNNPTPTQEDIERALEGNLCRCTGYRPILDSMKKSCPCGLNLCNQVTDKAEMSICENSVSVEKTKDTTQDVIFPNELKLNKGYSDSSVTFKGTKYTWKRPTSLPEALHLLHTDPDATIVMGCTYIGYQIKSQTLTSEIIISCTHVKELNVLDTDSKEIVIGAAVTLATLENFLTSKLKLVKEGSKATFTALLSAIRWIGVEQIRSVATVGGHVMSKARNHDLQTLLMAAGATLTFHSEGSETSTTCKYNNDFIKNGKGSAGSGELLVSIVIPLTNENEHLYFFKQPHRRGFDYAIVNAGMYVSCKPGKPEIDKMRICFGNIGNRPQLITSINGLDITKKWSDDMLTSVSSTIEEAFKSVEASSLQYKLTLALSFFYKFFLKLQQDIKADVSSTNELLLDSTRSEIYSAQYYDVPNQEGNKIVWQPTKHESAMPITTGEALYIDDIPSYKNELFVAHVGSQRPHAKIVSVDPSAALAMEGVIDYIDHRDVPGLDAYGVVVKDGKLFAEEEVRCIGQPIGAILAETREQAREATKRVHVTYEDLPAIFTIEEAVKASSLYPWERKLVQGDAEKALTEAEITLEDDIESGAQEHLYMEPQSCLVVPKKEHKEMEIFTSSQELHNMQHDIGEFLQIPLNKIVTKVKRLGGGFGGKAMDSVLIAGIAAVAAWKHSRPVRSIYDRKYDMAITGKRHGMKSHYKVGFDKTGKISALSIDFFINAGYTTDVSPFIPDIANVAFSVPYKIPHFRAVGKLCKTNLPSNTAMRGFGGPQATLVRESIMCDIARHLNIPVNKIREINMFREGDTLIQHKILTDFNLPLCISKCTEQSHYDAVLGEVQAFNKQNRWRKRGVAMSNVMFSIGYPMPFQNQAGALVQIYLDGSVLLTHGGIEMGQGLHTKVNQVAATVLDLPLEKIHISETSIDKVPNTFSSGGSYVADVNAGAVMNACLKLKARLEPIKASNPDASWEELVNTAYLQQISLSAVGHYTPAGRKEGYNSDTNTGNLCEYFTFGAACTLVEIDCLTGEHEILKTDIVMDVGKSLNPAVDIGQIEGGFMMGCGMMTSEQVTVTPTGRVESVGPINYKVPGIRNIPKQFKVTLLKEVKGGGSIYSAKGIGEPPLLLGSTVHLALTEAVLAARMENGCTDKYHLPCPASPEEIRLGCGDAFTKKFENYKQKGKKTVI